MPPFVAAYGTADPSSTTGGLYLSDDRQALITAILSAGSFTGALLGVPTADFLGRRGAIFFAAMVFIAGVVCPWAFACAISESTTDTPFGISADRTNRSVSDLRCISGWKIHRRCKQGNC